MCWFYYRMRKYIFTLIVFYVIISSSVECHGKEENSRSLRRNKRGLVFPLGGTLKLVIGTSTPVKLSKTRTIAVGWNFQWQYPLAVNTSVVKTYPPIISRKTREDIDVRRDEIYNALENFLIGQNENLEGCLLRYICEEGFSSFNHDSNGVYGRLLHVLLSPSDIDDGQLDNKYFEAHSAGKFGVDCQSLYVNCDVKLLMNGFFPTDFT
ncbi:hypothetical protein HHI36_021283 [Cryptolaemus montrouzieri]|uniref:Uncharacterized protein n=1 Tax=Cryptolaemus montrouzieri TaxID=559131 RepID=A0ABD2MWC0_9CUCU